MNIKTQNEFQQLVRRILGEEAEEFIQSNIENYEFREAERTLLSVGIDPDELFEQTVDDIRLTERLIDNGIDPAEAASRIVSAVEANQREIIIAEGLEEAIGELRRTPDQLLDQVAGMVAAGYMEKMEAEG